MHSPIITPLPEPLDAIAFSEATGKRARRVRRIGILVAIWLVPGLVGGFSLAKLAGGPQEESPVSLVRGLTWQFIAWIAWVPWTALVIWLVRRVPFTRANWWRALGVHLVVGSCATVTQILWAVFLDRVFWPDGVTSTVREHIQSGFVRLADFEVVIYMAVVTAGFAYDYFRRYRAGLLAGERLRTQMAHAQLVTLRSQLNPHFLFNALNSVNSLMERDVPAAQQAVVRLGDLLRLSLNASDAEVPLARELQLVRQYLEIERVRFGDRLSITIDVPAEVMQHPVPNLVLQPLVENAIEHGIGPRPGPGTVTVSATLERAALVLRVTDDGVGLVKSAKSNGNGHGIGVGNTRARLEAMYGPAGTLKLRAAEGGGCIAEVRLPLSRGPQNGSARES